MTENDQTPWITIHDATQGEMAYACECKKRFFRPVCIRHPHGFSGGPVGYQETGSADGGPIIVKPGEPIMDEVQRRQEAMRLAFLEAETQAEVLDVIEQICDSGLLPLHEVEEILDWRENQCHMP